MRSLAVLCGGRIEAALLRVRPPPPGPPRAHALVADLHAPPVCSIRKLAQHVAVPAAPRSRELDRLQRGAAGGGVRGQQQREQLLLRRT